MGMAEEHRGGCYIREGEKKTTTLRFGKAVTAED